MGTRAGLHGQTLVSTGHGTLDALLGGGLPRGSILVVDSIQHQGVPNALLRLFLAEGVVCGQHCAWFTTKEAPTQKLNALPALAKKGNSTHKDQEESERNDGAESLRIAWQYRRYLNSGEDSQDSVGSRTTNGNAKPKRIGGTSGHEAALKGAAREWCHRYDLRKRMDKETIHTHGGKLEVYGMGNLSGMEEVLQACMNFAKEPRQTSTQTSNHDQNSEPKEDERSNRPEHSPNSSVSGPNGDSSATTAQTSFKRFGKMSLADAFVKRKAASQTSADQSLPEKDKKGSVGTQSGPDRVAVSSEVKRIVIECLGSHEWSLQFGEDEEAIEEADMLNTLLTIRHIAQVTDCVIFVAASLGMCSDSFSMKVRHFADAVIALDPLVGEKEFYASLPDPTSCTNLLRVVKLPIMGSLGPVSAPPIGQTYLVRNKRHKIIVEELALPPEDAGTGEAKDQSVAQLVCGAPSSTSGMLEF